jgi:peroxiredoxin/sugar phosphate isomerase/epimerase
MQAGSRVSNFRCQRLELPMLSFSKWIVFGLLTIGVSRIATAQPPGFENLEIGAKIPDFRLTGVDGDTYQVDSFGDSQLLVVIFTCNHCPTAQAYETRIKQLDNDYRDQGVQLIAITPNDPLAVRLDELGYSDMGDSFEETKRRAAEIGFEFPYLFDGESQATSLQFGVLATPHVFIFDEDRRLRYKGRIDDSEVGTVKAKDVRLALDALLAGQPVTRPVTRPFGCSAKWSTKRDAARKAVEKWDQEPVELEMLSPAGLKELAANKTDNYRLINVWATWCIPCVEELPEFVTINRMYRSRNFEMITISADEPGQRDSVIETLKKKKVACQNFLFDSDSRDELFEGLDPGWNGGVPFTVLIAPGGKIVYRKHDEIDPAKLKHEIADRLGRTYATQKVPRQPAAGERENDLSNDPALESKKVPENFKVSNLVAWCFVPFDAKDRSPRERCEMLEKLGLNRVAYDWRDRHIEEFDEEFAQYKKNRIELFAFWSWHDSVEPLIRKYQFRPQIWYMIPRQPTTGDGDRIRAAAESLLPMVEKTKSLGLKLGLYNHGGWEGEPATMVSVCEYLHKNHDANNVGIVYNFHHGHEHIDRFESSIGKMLPYLLCVNLNGMVKVERFDENNRKILPIGSGTQERAMIETLIAVGYRGPVGILDHRSDMDAEKSLRQNLEGLRTLLREMPK